MGVVSHHATPSSPKGYLLRGNDQGRRSQQTFVNTCSKWAAAKLYMTKTPITAAVLLND